MKQCSQTDRKEENKVFKGEYLGYSGILSEHGIPVSSSLDYTVICQMRTSTGAVVASISSSVITSGSNVYYSGRIPTDKPGNYDIRFVVAPSGSESIVVSNSSRKLTILD